MKMVKGSLLVSLGTTSVTLAT